MEFEKIIDRLSPSDYRFDKVIRNVLDLDDAVVDELFEKLNSSGCKLGGYAHFTQDDPRDSIDNRDWLLLLQIDSVTENGVEIMWGDVGVANFFIQAEDLNKRDFSRVLYNWDCC